MKLSGQGYFQAAHFLGLGFRDALVIVSKQMQHSVNEQPLDLVSKRCPI